MPITKREAHYGSPKQLINYILDEKHNGEKVGQISGVNCNPETALLEFKDIQRKYKMKGSRVAYNIIQSFCFCFIIILSFQVILTFSLVQGRIFQV